MTHPNLSANTCAGVSSACAFAIRNSSFQSACLEASFALAGGGVGLGLLPHLLLLVDGALLARAWKSAISSSRRRAADSSTATAAPEAAPSSLAGLALVPYAHRLQSWLQLAPPSAAAPISEAALLLKYRPIQADRRSPARAAMLACYCPMAGAAYNTLHTRA